MAKTQTKPNRMVRTILVLSLALNVAVIGGAVGMIASGRAHEGPPQRMMFDFGPVGSVLNPEDRRAISQTMRKGGARPLDRRELDAKIDILAATLRTMPFDVGAVQEIMATFRQRSESVQQEAQGAFLAHLAAMSPQERVDLADRLEQRARKRD